MISKQNLLDNIVWIVAKAREYNVDISKIKDKLLNDFEIYLYEIYGNTKRKNESTCNNYYEAWKLRGDNPYHYIYKNELYKDNLRHAEYVTFWEKCELNNYSPELRSIRNKEVCRDLFIDYHFNPYVKKKGDEVTEYKIHVGYCDVIYQLQNHMQREICDKRIGIETNPSSNYLIGTFKRYDKHHIFRYFNLGLTVDPEKIAACPQMFVSINTDDQGIFATNLENEYAYICLALEKARDKNGNKIYNQAMIYDWIERIRQMGREQSFIDK